VLVGESRLRQITSWRAQHNSSSWCSRECSPYRRRQRRWVCVSLLR